MAAVLEGAFELSERVLRSITSLNKAIEAAEDTQSMLASAMDVLLEVFECDRAFLLYPCDPESAHWCVPVERTTREWPGAGVTQANIPMTAYARSVMREALNAGHAVRRDPNWNPIDRNDPVNRDFHIRSQLTLAISPPGDCPWLLGIHHCARARNYAGDTRLFEAMGGRIASALATHTTLQRLREREAKFRALVDSAPDAIVVCDIEADRLIDANLRAEEMFGLPREELLARSLSGASAERQPETGAPRQELLRRARCAAEGERLRFGWTFVASCGELPCEVHLAPFPDARQSLVRVSLVDIREKKAAEQEQSRLRAQLQRAQRLEAIGQLTGGIAHDFNNLLSVLNGNLESLCAQCEQPYSAERDAAMAEQAREAFEAAVRGGSLVQRLLAFASQQPLLPRPVHLSELIRGIESLLRRSLERGIGLELQLEQRNWCCQLDSAQLENAVLNLAINARDAMPAGGHMVVRTAEHKVTSEEDPLRAQGVPLGQYVLVSVSDDGAGMSEEQLSQCCEPFFTTKKPGRGTGLGLSMVFGFARQSGGHLCFHSAVGEGTKVTLIFPRCDAPGASEEVGASDPEPEAAAARGHQSVIPGATQHGNPTPA